MTRAAALALLAATACTPSSPRGVRPLGEDPVALLPSGADAIIDVDVAQLRVWQPSKRVWALLRRGVPALGSGGIDPLEDVEALHLALYDLGTSRQRALWIMRAEVEPERVVGAEASKDDYRGLPLWQTSTLSVARLTPKLLVGGSADDVRRALDLARDVGDSVRSQKPLMAALARCPTARSGPRPAVLGAVVLGDTLRTRLQREDLPASEAEWLSLGVAVGNGFDAEIIATLRGPAEADTMARAASERVAEFGKKNAIRILGLQPLVQAFSVRKKENEVFLVYRLVGATLSRMLARVEALQPPETAVKKP